MIIIDHLQVCLGNRLNFLEKAPIYSVLGERFGYSKQERNNGKKYRY